MNFTRHFLIEGQYLGSALCPAEFIKSSSRMVPPKGNCFFCPHCARLWAECPVEGQSAMVWTATCKNHRPGDATGGMPTAERSGSMMVSPNEIPGSIFLPWDEPFSASFPPRVVEWEFVRAIEWAASELSGPVARACSDMVSYLSRQTKRSNL